VVGAALAVSVLTRERGHSWLLIGLIVLGALLLLALLEAVPRALVARNPERWSLRLAPFMGAFKLLFGGAGRLLALPARVVGRPVTLEEEDMLRLLEIEEAEGDLEDDERKMIRGVFGLEDKAVREIMTPRTDLVALDTEATIQDALQLIVDRGFSRIPLYEKNADTIVGIVYAKDLLRDMVANKLPAQLRDVARPPFFVPESKRQDDLLTDMRRQRVHMAIVIDEYGGTAGLVTIEDLLEEIVGEIEDEYDRVEHPIVRVSEQEALVDGRVSIAELNELFHTDVEAQDFDTVGGCVFHHLGRVPVVGDAVEASGLRLTVLSVDGHRVRRVRAVQVGEPKPETREGNGGNGNGQSKRNGKAENGG
jgi:CBS domain containing-hemolysin-like protein